MTFNAGIFYQISLIIYVGVWAYFKYRPYKLLRKNMRPSLYEIEKLDEISSLVRRYGWLIVFFLPIPCVFLFPEVRIITQDPVRAKTELYGRYYSDMTPRKTFFVDRYYVPFYYNGTFCKPGKKYLSNETDSTLVLYPTYFYNGLFMETILTKQIKSISAHSFRQWDESIDNEFDEPNQYRGYVPEKHRNKSAKEWTIDTKSGAAMGIKEVENEIKKRYELMNGIWNK